MSMVGSDGNAFTFASAFGRNLASVALKILKFNLVYKEMFKKSYFQLGFARITLR
jgi:hypothetical protein